VALRKDERVYRNEAPLEVEVRERDLSAPIYQAYVIGRLTYTVAPIVMGADKFFMFLTNGKPWVDYLWPGIPRMTGIDAGLFMKGVGVVEIVAGVLFAIAPRFFGWLVAAWLGLIIVDLLLLGQYWDVAMRDLGLMLGAIVAARLAQAVHEARTT